MSIFNIFRKHVKVKEITAKDLGLENRSYDYDKNNAYKTVSAVYAAINAIATNMASLPVESFKLADKEFSKPLSISKTQNIIFGDNDALIQNIVISLLSFGVAYVMKQESLTGKLYDLDLLKFQYVTKQPDGYMYSKNGKTQFIPMNNMIVFKTPNPYNDLILSPISVAYKTLSAEYEGRQFTETMFRNGVVSTGVVEIDKDFDIDESVVEKIKSSFQNNFAGRRNIGKPIILQGATFKPISLNLKDIKFLELSQATVNDVMMIFGVPPIILGQYQNANYKVDTQRKLFWENTLIPLIAYLEKVFNIEFKSLNEKIKFNVSGIQALQEDTDSKVATAEKLLRMGFTLAQVNEKLNLGFDVSKLSWANSYLGDIPLQIQDTSKQKNVGENVTENVGEKISEIKKELKQKIGNKSEISEEDIKLWNDVDAIVKSQEENYAKKLSNYFYKIRKELLKKVEPHTVMADVIGNLDWHVKDQELINVSKPFISDVFLKSYDKILKEMGIDKANPYLDKNILDVIPDRFENVLLSNRTLKKELIKATGQGLSVDELATNIKHIMNITAGRAKVISQTNLVGASNHARFKGMSDNGIEEITWVSTPDNKTRESHRALNGETIKTGEQFTDGLSFPGDPQGAPEEVINCRCTIKANIKD